MSEKSTQIGEICVQVFQLNGLLNHWGDGFVADNGLTSARWQMLGALYLAAEPQTCPQVSEKMGMTRQGALKQLNRLVADGLIATQDNTAHKRSPLYVLTDKGTKAYQTVAKRWDEVATQIAETFEPQDLEVALKVLEQMSAYFKNFQK